MLFGLPHTTHCVVVLTVICQMSGVQYTRHCASLLSSRHGTKLGECQTDSIVLPYMVLYSTR